MKKFLEYSVSILTLLIAVFFIAGIHQVFAATITVNSTADTVDAGAGNCTLRGAIANANAQGVSDPTNGGCTFGASGTNTINFSSPMTIAPTGEYSISSPVILDATSTGVCTTKALGVVIDGSSIGGNIFNLDSGANGSTIEGFVLTNAPTGSAINLNGTSNVVVSCNVIGLNQAGTVAAGNQDGINVSGTTSDTIGGSNAGDGNIISGNTGAGILGLQTIGLIIENNWIGVGLDGHTPIPNEVNGISLGDNNNQSTNMTIEGNTVAGNNTSNNYGQIGLDNIDTLLITRNYIGLDSTGMVLIPDSSSSEVVLNNGISHATIGGPTPGTRNYIASSSDNGSQSSTIDIQDSISDSSIVGNYLGLNKSGVQVGHVDGIWLHTAVISNLTIGGTAINDGNIIAGGTIGGDVGFGSAIGNSDSTGSGLYIYGNKIGTNASGQIQGGYGNNIGVAGFHGMTDVHIVGLNSGEGNIIAGNGIGITNGDTPILENSIFGNTLALGHDVGLFSFTPKGTFGDGIESAGIAQVPSLSPPYRLINIGPNPNTPHNTNFATDGALNHPVLISSTDAGGGNISVAYALDVAAGNYRIEFFKNPTLGASASGFGEGETFIGSDTFTSTGSIATKSVTLSGVTSDVITADATQDFGAGAFGATSEFSNAIPSGVDTGTAPGHETLLSDNGAYHILSNNYLGTCIVADKGDAGHTILSYHKGTAPCTANNGIAFSASTSTPGSTVTANVTASASGFLNVWTDANQNGSFQDAGEHVVTNQAITAGSNAVNFSAPSNDGTYNVRFRYTSYNPGAMLPVGEATDGEVEDITLVVHTSASNIVLIYGCRDTAATNYNPNSGIAPNNSLCTYANNSVSTYTPGQTSLVSQTSQTTAVSPAVNASQPVVTMPFTKMFRKGMSDPEILQLQKFLNAHNAQVSATGFGSPGKEINTFGNKTMLALIQYQKANNIPPTGFFGPITMKWVNTVLSQGK